MMLSVRPPEAGLGRGALIESWGAATGLAGYLRSEGRIEAAATLRAVMGRVAIFAGAVLMVVLSGTASAATDGTLRMFEARSAAESAAFDFQTRRDLESSNVGRCKRQAPQRVVCMADASGESARRLHTCQLRIRIRSVYRTFYWDAVAAVTRHRCRSTPKPWLTYAAARAAIQAEADRFAGRATTIGSLGRRDDVTFAGSARWERPRTPPREFFGPTESCSVELTATLTERLISVTTEGFSCF